MLAPLLTTLLGQECDQASVSGDEEEWENKTANEIHCWDGTCCIVITCQKTDEWLPS